MAKCLPGGSTRGQIWYGVEELLGEGREGGGVL